MDEYCGWRVSFHLLEIVHEKCYLEINSCVKIHEKCSLEIDSVKMHESKICHC